MTFGAGALAAGTETAHLKRSMRVAAAVAVVIVLAAPGCGDPSGPQQTIHTLPVVTDETWTRAASPHIVRGHLFISYGATLTIEAGATVLFDTLSLLTFGSAGGPGALRALGTSAQPITMRSLDTTAAPGFWVGLALRSNTASWWSTISTRWYGRLKS